MLHTSLKRGALLVALALAAASQASALVYFDPIITTSFTAAPGSIATGGTSTLNLHLELSGGNVCSPRAPWQTKGLLAGL